MDCRVGVCAGSHHQKAAESGVEPLHNSTDFECNVFRESLYNLQVLTETGYKTENDDLPRSHFITYRMACFQYQKRGFSRL
jgi:hypothetical protein